MQARPRRHPIHAAVARLALALILAAATLPFAACGKEPEEETALPPKPKQASPETKPVAKTERIGTLPVEAEDVSLRQSKHGRRVWYTYKKAGKEFVVIDGNVEGPFDRASVPAFSADGRRAGYRYIKDDKGFIVMDGKTEGPFDEAQGPGFSANGRAVYLYKKDGKRFVVFDGKIEGPFDKFGKLKFAANRRHVLYSYMKDDKVFIVINGKIVLAEKISIDGKTTKGSIHAFGRPAFSANGKTLIIVYQKGWEIFKKTIPLE